MAIVSLFFQTRAVIGRPSGSPTGGMELDASISEQHEATATVTQNPVEDASNVNDHVVLNPVKLTLEGIVSKSPLGLGALAAAAVTTAATAAGGASAGAGALTSGLLTTGIASLGGLVASALGANGPNSREPKDVYDFLLEIRNRRIPFDVVTALKLYQNMILTSVVAPRSIQTVNVLRFTAVLEQVTIVSAETVDLGSTSSLGGAAGAATNLGSQGASAASSATGNNASILFNLFGGG